MGSSWRQPCSHPSSAACCEPIVEGRCRCLQPGHPPHRACLPSRRPAAFATALRSHPHQPWLRAGWIPELHRRQASRANGTRPLPFIARCAPLAARIKLAQPSRTQPCGALRRLLPPCPSAPVRIFPGRRSDPQRRQRRAGSEDLQKPERRRRWPDAGSVTLSAIPRREDPPILRSAEAGQHLRSAPPVPPPPGVK